MFKNCFFCFLLLLTSAKIKASKIEKGFEALRVFNYFEAKQFFYKSNQSTLNPYSSYGLSLVFYKNNNPFFNLDSAAKYAYISYHAYKNVPIKKTYSNFEISDSTIINLIDSITFKQYQITERLNTIIDYNIFLNTYYLANKKILKRVLFLRDELEFNRILKINKSDTTSDYLLLHPQSSFYTDAYLLRDRQIFDESIHDKTDKEYIEFLKKYPKNIMINKAYQKIFEIYKNENDRIGLKFFILNYPNAPQFINAWKLLFFLSVKSFNDSALNSFLINHPDFPFKSSILKEIELNSKILFPVLQGDYYSFVNENGATVIPPIFETVSEFKDGLSVVSKNDSVYFINKDNINVFEKYFEDAFVFIQGIAPVKQNSKWYFINRHGQKLSEYYDEINELCNDVYVFKIGEKYGVLDYFGQQMIEPKFEKLGDFKNDMAYFIEKGNYGFISKEGFLYKASFQWISDFNKEKKAVFKLNNKYGLINSIGKIILEPLYDQIIQTDYSVYIILKENNYGFFSSDSCFLSTLDFNFLKDKPIDFYTNGKLFKFLKKSEQALVNENGFFLINFGLYDEVYFPSNELIRVKKKNLYGYLDSKFKISIPFKFDQADDFIDSIALVNLKDDYLMINIIGKTIFSSSSLIKKISKHYFVNTTSEGLFQIISNEGQVLFKDIKEFHKINNQLFFLTSKANEIKSLKDW